MALTIKAGKWLQENGDMAVITGTHYSGFYEELMWSGERRRPSGQPYETGALWRKDGSPYAGHCQGERIIAPWKPLRPKPKRKAGRARGGKAQWEVAVPCSDRAAARHMQNLAVLCWRGRMAGKPTVRRINLPDAGQGRV